MDFNDRRRTPETLNDAREQFAGDFESLRSEGYALPKNYHAPGTPLPGFTSKNRRTGEYGLFQVTPTGVKNLGTAPDKKSGRKYLNGQ